MSEIELCSSEIPTYDSYKITQHIISFSSLLVNLLTAFCILCRSPAHMGSFKFVLFYHIFAATVLDILLSNAILPVMLLPYLAGYSLGFLKFIDIGALTIIAFAVCGFVMTSIVLLFAWRHYQILPSFDRLQLSKTKKIIGCMLLHIYIVAGLPVVANKLPIQNELKDQLVKKIQSSGHCVIPELLLPSTFLLDVTAVPYIAIAVIYMSSATCLSAFFIFNALRCISTMNHISQMQRALQRKYFFTLLLQICIPVCIIFVPVVFMIGIVARDLRDQSNRCQDRI
ncbi:hypothetical protein WR25_00397 [Diploscapter pachys]|uniref:G-protein coupled receptors family 1 profile domain-containing protein n=1 Tax=Diploscapter pachys TaxID=2018661 RepID=A0A2A2KPU9_9BILA|nr:hypothetical protein WR25_00397 [Diploscapter pachys]